MVSGVGSRDLIWQCMRSLAHARWGTERWVRWLGQCLECIWSRAVLCKAEKEMRCTVTQWNLAAHHCLFRMGPRYGRFSPSVNVNHLGWLRMVCVDIRASWRPGVSATVLVDGLHWSHRCLRRLCQSFDGVVPGSSPLRGWFQVVPISCRRCLNHIILVCGILKRLALSAVVKLVCSILIVIYMSTMVRS